MLTIEEQKALIEKILREHPYLSFEGNLLDVTISDLAQKIVDALGR
ncbi:hypothetical protein FY034_17580 (plasmid) [Trichlorobacter lovleyi]|nr:hypothetical protein [Trichlorobacter lovleyi]QOX80835.1 hypothetical protein FY034_17580 [Trichlorobacter lovleyi]